MESAHHDARTLDGAALVLAAGFSQRFGSDKRIASMPDGTSVLSTTLNLASAVFPEVTLVVRDDDDPGPLEVPGSVNIVRAPHADIGMGSSLAAGIQALQSHSGPDSVAILLGDMPWIAKATLTQLMKASARDNIVLPYYAGQRGHPVIFGREFWPELAKLSGNTGGRHVIGKHPDACHHIELGDSGILLDIDRPEDLRS